ncbi:MAG: winged helix DNA-binding protein [Faecalibacterium sp.]|nr:winged helix DNA-binding protein [Ruminococcus sp.]MCM1391376.1 winged helix DNA-binding protein [Ruminococcus sp.]MCM1484586.1 winged helix DNA-binding protein [Faecalibacterium sp.]
MRKDELRTEIINVFAGLSHMRTFGDIQTNLKGENFLLAHLFNSGGESTPGKLAEFLDVSAARIAAILRSLESKDFIERISDGKDKRRIMVKLTEDGRKWVDSIQCDIIRHASDVLEGLGEEDSAELVRILKKIIHLENKRAEALNKK